MPLQPTLKMIENDHAIDIMGTIEVITELVDLNVASTTIHDISASNAQSIPHNNNEITDNASAISNDGDKLNTTVGTGTVTNNTDDPTTVTTTDHGSVTKSSPPKRMSMLLSPRSSSSHVHNLSSTNHRVIDIGK